MALVTFFAVVVPATATPSPDDPGDVVCHEIEDAALADEPRWREVGDGSCRLRTRADLVCFGPGEASTPEHPRDQLCYRWKCDGSDEPEPQLLEDLFGSRIVLRRGAAYVCVSATISAADASGEDSDRDGGAPSAAAASSITPRAIPLRVCGDFSGEGSISATDALGTLRSAVGSAACLPCVCDVDSSGTFTATDALRVLRNAVGQGVPLTCQPDGNPVSWTGAADDVSWHLPGNWSLGTRLPNLCDAVTISGAGATIVHSQGTDGVRSIQSTRQIDLTGGSLQTRDTVFVDGTLRFAGGTLKDSTVLAAAPVNAAAEGSGAGSGAIVLFSGSGGLADNVTFDADMSLLATSSSVRVSNGMTVNGTASMGNASNIRFQGGTQTLDGSGVIYFSGTAGKSITIDTGTTVTIAEDMTIRGGAGTIGSQGAFVNEGLVDSDESGEILLTSTSGGWTNAGLIRGRNGGDVELNGIWTNSAQVQIADSGELTLNGNWSNAGTITSDASTVNLGGTFTLADLGTFTRNGGLVNITGTFDNETDLVLDDQTGSWRLVGGTILGGAVTAEESAELIATGSGGALDAVTLVTGMNMTATSSSARIRNGLQLDGTVTMGNTANLRFEGGTQLLSGTGEVVFQGTGGKSVTVDSGTTATIGPEMTIRGAAGTVGSSGALIIEGLVHSDLPGEIRIQSTQGWTNEGTVQASGGGDLQLSGIWTNNAEVTIAGGGALTLEGTWHNMGTIDSTDSIVNLGGTFTLAALGDFSRSGGTVNLTGTFQNTTDLLLDAMTGDWVLRGGSIVGGSVDGADGAGLVLSGSGGLLDGVTMLSPMDMTTTSAAVRIQNGLELNDTATMGSASNIRFQGGQQVLSGDGEIVFQGASGKSITVDSGTTLTIGEFITIRGAVGTVGSSGMMVNEGAIVSDEPGKITVQSTQGWTNKGEVRARDGGDLDLSGVWSNEALVSVEDGGVLSLEGDWSNTGKLIAEASTVNLGGTFTLADLGTFGRTGGTVNITGTFQNTTDLVLDMDTGDWRLSGGTILGGTVSAQDGAELVGTGSGGLLDGVTLEAPFDMSATSSAVRVQNGLTLAAAVTMGSAGNLRIQGGTQTIDGTGEIIFQGAGGKSVTVDSGAKLIVGDDVTIRGATGTVGSTGELEIRGTIDSDAPGDITITSTQGWTNKGLLRASGGGLRLTGTGSNSDGTIEIGTAHAVTAPNGFTQGAGGTVVLHLGSILQFAKITVTGAANLAGTLEIELDNSFDPPIGTTFQIMTFGSRVGDFTTVAGLDIGNGKVLQRSTTATTMTLEVVSE